MIKLFLTPKTGELCKCIEGAKPNEWISLLKRTGPCKNCVAWITNGFGLDLQYFDIVLQILKLQERQQRSSRHTASQLAKCYTSNLSRSQDGDCAFQTLKQHGLHSPPPQASFRRMKWIKILQRRETAKTWQYLEEEYDSLYVQAVTEPTQRIRVFVWPSSVAPKLLPNWCSLHLGAMPEP